MISYDIPAKELIGAKVKVFNRYFWDKPVVGEVVDANEDAGTLRVTTTTLMVTGSRFYFRECLELVTEAPSEKAIVRRDMANAIVLKYSDMENGSHFDISGDRLIKTVCFKDDITIMPDEEVSNEIVKCRWNACMFRMKELCGKLMV